MSETDDNGEQPTLARPNGISYLHIPRGGSNRTAAFYGEVFGWVIRDQETKSPAFRDGSGHVIGHFLDDHEVAGQAGVRPYVYVEDVANVVERIPAAGGEIVKAPFKEGDVIVAHFRDPAGNVLGIWQFAIPS